MRPRLWKLPLDPALNPWLNRCEIWCSAKQKEKHKSSRHNFLTGCVFIYFSRTAAPRCKKYCFYRRNESARLLNSWCGAKLRDTTRTLTMHVCGVVDALDMGHCIFTMFLASRYGAGCMRFWSFGCMGKSSKKWIGAKTHPKSIQ